ncbi:MAG: hypothetical protein EA416_04630 [Trueperaceae bacterium]|nr:MAG: hypothetical protein EA416_04630 [Trueperaceae bacterium]
MTYHRTTALVVVGWLYVVTGVTMLIAPFFAFQAAGGLAINGLVLGLGVVVLAAGAGLLRAAPWAWSLTLAIALSGVFVTAARLWTGGAPEGLVPALVTNLLTLLVLWLARRARTIAVD